MRTPAEEPCRLVINQDLEDGRQVSGGVISADAASAYANTQAKLIISPGYADGNYYGDGCTYTCVFIC